jgi:uncharacterized protein
VSFFNVLQILVARDNRFLALRESRWNGWWALLATAIVGCSFFVLGVGMWLVFRELAVNDDAAIQFNAATAENAGPLVGNPYSLINFVMIGVVFPIAIWMTARIQGQRLSTFIRLAGMFRWQSFWRMAGAFWLVQLIAIVVTLQFEAEDILFRSGALQNPVFLVAAVAVIAIQTFGEELVFRGYLFRIWSTVFLRPVLVTVFWSAVFAAIHISNPDVSLDPVPALLSIFIFALFAQWLVSRTGALDAAWGLHFATNVTAFLIIQSKPGYDSDASLILYTDRVLSKGGSYALDPLAYIALISSYVAMLWLITDHRSPFYVERRG